MANIIKRNAPEAPAPHFEPFRWMRDFLRWDPFREMAPMPPMEPLRLDPAFDIKETKEQYLIKADLPGVAEKDVEVNLRGNRLLIKGMREQEKEEKGETFYTCERQYGSFSRSFVLPEEVDIEHVTAALKEGVLTIALPKKVEVAPKRIEIKTGEKQS